MFGFYGLGRSKHGMRLSCSDTATGFSIGTGRRKTGAHNTTVYGATGARVRRSVHKVRRTYCRHRKPSFSHDVVAPLIVASLGGAVLLALACTMPVNGLALMALVVAVAVAAILGYLVTRSKFKRRDEKHYAGLRKSRN